RRGKSVGVAGAIHLVGGWVDGDGKADVLVIRGARYCGVDDAAAVEGKLGHVGIEGPLRFFYHLTGEGGGSGEPGDIYAGGIDGNCVHFLVAAASKISREQDGSLR